MTNQAVELLWTVSRGYEEAMAREGISPQARGRVHNLAMLGSPEGPRGIRWTDPDEQIPFRTVEQMREEEQRFRRDTSRADLELPPARHAKGDI